MDNKIAIEIFNNDQYKEVVSWFRCKGFPDDDTLLDTYVRQYNCIGISPRNQHVDNRLSGWWEGQGYTVIPYCEWKEQVVPPKIGRIIGYKLLKDYPQMPELLKEKRELVVTSWYAPDKPNVSIAGRKFPVAFGYENVEKYPEFWEPIYEPEFKVGDWLTYRSNSDGVITAPIQAIGDYYTMPHATIARDGSGIQFRRATPEEIEKATTTRITLGSGTPREFVIKKDSLAAVTCTGTHMRIEPLVLWKMLDQIPISDYKANIESISVGETSFTRIELQALWARFRDINPDWTPGQLVSNKGETTKKARPMP